MYPPKDNKSKNQNTVTTILIKVQFLVIKANQSQIIANASAQSSY